MKNENNPVSFCAVGDISLSNEVENKIEQKGEGHIFQKISKYLLENDIVFGNLENVFTNSCSGKTGQAHILKCKPGKMTEVKNAGFNVVSLANNHITDYSEQGLFDTIECLDQNKILHTGAGQNLISARRPAIIGKKGIRFGFLSYAMKGVQSADENRAGAAVIDYEQIADDIVGLRPEVEHIIVSLHTGFEFIDYPHPDYRQLCKKIAQLGVTIIIGHHPHVVQGVENFGDCLVAYSLGNFIFDVNMMDYKTDRTRESLILKCKLDSKKIIDYEFIPTIINSEFQIEKADYEREGQIKARFDTISNLLTSNKYPEVYFKQVSELWPKINIAVNLKIIKSQGLKAFLKRLPRIKKIYIILTLKYVLNKTKGFIRKFTAFFKLKSKNV